MNSCMAVEGCLYLCISNYFVELGRLLCIALFLRGGCVGFYFCGTMEFGCAARCWGLDLEVVFWGVARFCFVGWCGGPIFRICRV